MADKAGPELQRRVTQISGERLRPLHLLGGTPKQTSKGTTSQSQQKRQLPVNNNKLSFLPRKVTENQGKKAKPTGGFLTSQPKVTYHGFLRLDQAGSATIASDNTKSCSLVAIKTLKPQHASPDSIRPVTHQNIVSILDVYRKADNEICMVSELMDVSLSLVNSVARERWGVYEIAAVCRDVSPANCGAAGSDLV